MRVLGLAVILFVAPLGALADSVKYRVDTANSNLGFVYFFGDKPTKGRFPEFDADISVDFESVSNSAISVTLDVTKASAGLFLATDAMLGETVLNAAQFPEITFKSTKVRLGEHPTVIVSGDLTVRDVTRSIDFVATLIVENSEQAAKRERLLIQLDTAFSRSAFGAGGFTDMVEDRMLLNAEIAIVRDK